MITNINEFKKYLNNTVKPINEGQFSWFTQDSREQIGSEPQNTIDVYMFDNKGNKFHEPNYDGYGNFGGKDYYDLLAEMNGITQEMADSVGQELRILGINIAYYSEYDTNTEYGKNVIDTLNKLGYTGQDALYPALVTNPNFNWQSHDFHQEPESDPNQSWYQEEENDDWFGYDDEEDEDYDDEDYDEEFESKRNKRNKSSKINENSGPLHLGDRFIVSNPASILVEDIISDMLWKINLHTDDQYEDDDHLKNEILNRLTSEICQNYLDTIEEERSSFEHEEDYNDWKYDYANDLLIELGIINDEFEVLV